MRGKNAAELVSDIERQVAEGILQPGDRLPPVRVLAGELALAPNTVAAAYRRLGERGIVIGRGRNGTFIAARPPVALPAEPDVAPGLLDLARGNPDPSLLPAIPVPDPGRVVLYGDDPVDSALRMLASMSLSDDGIPADHITVVSGALDGIERTMQAHLRPGDRVAIEDPAYASVVDLIGALGLQPVPIEIDDQGFIPDALATALGSGVSCLVVTPRAQNPMGAALDADRAGTLRSIIAPHPEVVLIEDDHAGAVAGVPYVTLVHEDRRHWAVIRSAAKSYGPDLRLALVATDETTLRRVQGRQALGQGWVSHVLQRMVAAFMDDPEVDRHLRSVAEQYGDRRVALIASLADRGVSAHGRSGLNVWIPVTDEQAAVSGMRDRGIAVRAGERFRHRSGPGIRITTAALPIEEAPVIADAVAAAVAENRQATRNA